MFDKSFFLILISSISYYIFGLITNDIRDMKEDAGTNAKRPLPSGKIKLTHAKFASVVLLSVAIFSGFSANFACGIIGLILLLCIVLYNFIFKENRFLAPFLLASCRILNVLLGVSFYGLPLIGVAILPLIYFVLLYFIFVFGISVAAKDELSSDFMSFITGSSLILFSLSLLYLLSISRLVFLIIKLGLFPPAYLTALIAMLILASFFAQLWINRMWKGERHIATDIGRLICGMILFQTIFLSTSGFRWESWMLLSLFPISLASSILFKGS